MAEYALHVKDGELYAVQGNREGFDILSLVGVQEKESPRIAAYNHLGTRAGKKLHIWIEPQSEGVWKVPYHYEDLQGK